MQNTDALEDWRKRLVRRKKAMLHQASQRSPRCRHKSGRENVSRRCSYPDLGGCGVIVGRPFAVALAGTGPCVVG